jgi:WD40 repeat protein
VATGNEQATLQGHNDQVFSMAFSPDGKTLASSGSSDGMIKLWDVATGNERATLKGHRGVVTSVAFSPDGKTLASGSRDDTIKLRDMATLKQADK